MKPDKQKKVLKDKRASNRGVKKKINPRFIYLQKKGEVEREREKSRRKLYAAAREKTICGTRKNKRIFRFFRTKTIFRIVTLLPQEFFPFGFTFCEIRIEHLILGFSCTAWLEKKQFKSKNGIEIK